MGEGLRRTAQDHTGKEGWMEVINLPYVCVCVCVYKYQSKSH
jgi:hypothetical protein